MDEATVVFSRQGLFKQRVGARAITSREDARHLWPFVSDGEGSEVVTWVRPSFADDGRLIRRSCFKRLPKARVDMTSVLETEEGQRRNWSSESPEHQRAKQLIAGELRKRLKDGEPLWWAFKDARVSDFSMRGNLLRCAEQVKEEQKVVTAFGHPLILDVAVLGERYQGRPVLLGGIEIERTHEFEGRKALLGRALAFPLISVDISDMTLSQITPEWARSILELRTLDHEDGRRRSYVYLHDVLYPVFIQIPTLLRSVKDRHQYLVFAPDDELAGFLKALEQMKDWFRFSSEISLMRVNGSKNAQARKPVLTAAGIVGADWEQYNDHQFLRVTLDRPCAAESDEVWLCHMLLARILLRHGRALIGYQYMNNAYNHNPDEDLWVHVHYDAGAKVTTKHRVLPKRLGDSLERMMSVLASLGLAKSHGKVD